MLHPGRVVEHQSASSSRAGRCVVVRRVHGLWNKPSVRLLDYLSHKHCGNGLGEQRNKPKKDGSRILRCAHSNVTGETETLRGSRCSFRTASERNFSCLEPPVAC